jgi:type VI secretion system protein VasD
MEMVKKSAALVLLASIIALAGCKSAPPVEQDTVAQLNIAVSADVNPDSDQRPSPLVITVFALKDSRQFEREDFLSLYEGASQRLGADLARTIKLKEFVPGETRLETIPLDPGVRYLGVMAEYVQYDKAKATLVLPVIERKTNRFEVKAERLQLTGAAD